MARRRRERTPEPRAEASQRQLRVGEEIRHVLARLLREGDLRDPALQDVSITVTEVRVSPDLRSATAFVMPLGGAHAEEIVAALQRAAGLLKGRIGRELPLRYAPSLVFVLDRSFDQADRISTLLHSPAVERDLERTPDDSDAG